MTTYPRKTLLLLTLACLLLAVDQAEAGAFPRGLGHYFSPYRLAATVIALLGWVKLCAWVDRDVASYKLSPASWNSLVLLTGVAGFFLLATLSNFWFSWIFFWLLLLGATGWYIYVRNPHAPPDERLFTEQHFKYLAGRYLNMKFKGQKVSKGPKVPVRIFSRGKQSEMDGQSMQRVQASKGYRGALEMIYEAYKKRATDIHLEPTENEMSVRFRIDGVMTNQMPFSRGIGDGVVNLLKVVSNLDITEKRKPQDGSFSAQVESATLEFRVATAGSVVGEKMVLRLLDSSQAIADLGHVGLDEDLAMKVRDLVSQPHGLFLVCGPTGSGKSTTLYACLQEIDRYAQNIITLENPVEYRLDNVTQIEINLKAGKTFAEELRSILRQDPDVIMVGEIRDKETAEIACQAAQTGHLVFSTIHANDSTLAVARLLDLGVQPFLISSALSGVLAQRLVRKLCPDCKQRYKPTPDALRRLKAENENVRFLYRAKTVKEPEEGEEAEEEACEKCGGTGYYKRTGIFELFAVNDKIRQMIRDNPNMVEIRQEAENEGWVSLFDYGKRLVLEGETSLQELLRVSR